MSLLKKLVQTIALALLAMLTVATLMQAFVPRPDVRRPDVAAAPPALPAPTPEPVVTQIQLPATEITNRNYDRDCGQAAFADSCQGKTALLRGNVEAGCWPFNDACVFKFETGQSKPVKVTLRIDSKLKAEIGSEVLVSATLGKVYSDKAELVDARVFSVLKTPKQIELDNMTYWPATDADLTAHMKEFRQACYDSSFLKWPSESVAVSNYNITVAGLRDVARFGYDKARRKVINLCLPQLATYGVEHGRGFTCTEGTPQPSWVYRDQIKFSDCTNAVAGNPNH